MEGESYLTRTEVLINKTGQNDTKMEIGNPARWKDADWGNQFISYGKKTWKKEKKIRSVEQTEWYNGKRNLKQEGWIKIHRGWEVRAILIAFCMELCTLTKRYPTRFCGSSVSTKRRVYISICRGENGVKIGKEGRK